MLLLVVRYGRITSVYSVFYFFFDYFTIVVTCVDGKIDLFFHFISYILRMRNAL